MSCHRGDRRVKDRGAAILETTILMPIFLTLIVLIAQFALAAQAKQVVTAAAQDAAVDAARHGADPASAAARAEELAADNAGSTLSGYSATVSVDADMVTVTMSGQVQQVIPFLNLTVSGSGSALLEDWRP